MNDAKRTGYTLVEVTLVLAIGAFILMVVFLVIPSVQRARRDQQRKQDLGEVVTAIEQWIEQHDGYVPKATDFSPHGKTVADSPKETVVGGGLQHIKPDPMTGRPYMFGYNSDEPTDAPSMDECTSGAEDASPSHPDDNIPGTGSTGATGIAYQKLKNKRYAVRICLEQGSFVHVSGAP